MNRLIIVLCIVGLLPALCVAAGPVKFGVQANYATVNLGSANFTGTLKDA